MTFKGFAESSARGFKSFQIQLPTKEVLANMKEASNRELGYKKSNLQAYKENRREYLNALVAGQNATSKSLKEAQTFRNENLKQVQKWEMKRWQDKVDKAKEEVNRIGQYGQQNPSPSTLESIAGIIGDWAPKLAGIIQEQRVAEAKAEKDFRQNLILGTGITTKQINEIWNNWDAVRNQTDQGIELLRRTNAELGLSGNQAITVEQLTRLHGNTGEAQLHRDQLLAHNSVQQYPTFIESNLDTPLNQLWPGQFGEGETLGSILNPNAGYDHQRAADTLQKFYTKFLNDEQFGPLADLPHGMQAIGVAQFVRKHNAKYLADYARGVSKVRSAAFDRDLAGQFENAFFNEKQGGMTGAMVAEHARFAQRYKHLPGGGNAAANDFFYEWFRKNIRTGVVTGADIRKFNEQMTATYPDVWKGGKPARFRQLALEADAKMYSDMEQAGRGQRLRQKEFLESIPQLVQQNPDMLNMSAPELREFLTDQGLDNKTVNSAMTRFFTGNTQEPAGTTISREDGGRWEDLDEGMASLLVENHRKQNTTSILKPTDLTGGNATHGQKAMVTHITQRVAPFYNAEYRRTGDHDRAHDFALGKAEELIASGQYDMLPNEYTAEDGKSQQRTTPREFEWVNEPKGATQPSVAKATVITQYEELRKQNLSDDQIINKVTSPDFLPSEVPISSMAKFGSHPATQALLQRAPKKLTLSYLYSKRLEALGYEPLSDDRVLDPDEYTQLLQSSKPIADRLTMYATAPNPSEHVLDSHATGAHRFLRTSATVGAYNTGGTGNYGPYAPGRYPGRLNLTRADAEAMAVTIAGEAGTLLSGGFGGDDAMVAGVIINRMTDPRYPGTTAYEIVSRPGQFVGWRPGVTADPRIVNWLLSLEGQSVIIDALHQLEGRTSFKGLAEIHNKGKDDQQAHPRANFAHFKEQLHRDDPTLESYKRDHWKKLWMRMADIRGGGGFI